jgi:hypothetical protein
VAWLFVSLASSGGVCKRRCLILCCIFLTFQGAGDAPVKVFDRTPNLSGAQIISYRISPDTKWCVLIGITQGPPERYGNHSWGCVGGSVLLLYMALH